MACVTYCSSLYPRSKFWFCGGQWWNLTEFFMYAQEEKSSGITYREKSGHCQSISVAMFYPRSPKLWCKDTKGIPSCWNNVSLNPLSKSAWGILPTCLGTVCAAKRKPRRLEHSLFQETTMDIDRESVVCTFSAREWVLPHVPMLCLSTCLERWKWLCH